MLLTEEVTAYCWRKFSLRLPLALLEDASSTPSYASAVRFGTCSCRAECFRRLSNDAMRQPPLPRSPATSPDTSVDFNAEALQFAVQRRTGDTEGCCGLHTVPAGLTQRLDDRVSLD